MFGKRKHSTAENDITFFPIEDTAKQAPAQGANHEAEPEVDETAARNIGEQALATGFQQTESGLLVPDGTAKVKISAGDVLATDSRRFTLETIEANFKAEQDRLASPLDRKELFTAGALILEQTRQRAKDYDGDNKTIRADLERDPEAIHRLGSVLKGERDMYVSQVTDRDENLAPSEMLGRVVNQYAKLTPENFEPDSLISSMGGTVNIPENGVIHCEGYNGSILYSFARAKQVCDALEASPKDVREKILESSAPDASWILDQPVVVQPQPLEAVAV